MNSVPMSVAGKVALVTGGASGLGEATARRLCELGAKVLVFDRDEQRAKTIAAELGASADFAAGDATDEDDTLRAIDAAAALGELRMVVACAGGGTASQRTVKRDGTPHDLQLFVDTINLNLVTAFNTTRLCASHMATLEPDDRGERGAIVLTSSIAGYEGQIGQIAYGAAKAGIIGMTIIAARDLAAVGVRVNTIAPGTINTRAWERAPAEMKAALEAKVPFPSRFGEPQEFAALVVHLLENRYVNGTVVRLDGAIRFDPK